MGRAILGFALCLILALAAYTLYRIAKQALDNHLAKRRFSKVEKDLSESENKGTYGHSFNVIEVAKGYLPSIESDLVAFEIITYKDIDWFLRVTLKDLTNLDNETIITEINLSYINPALKNFAGKYAGKTYAEAYANKPTLAKMCIEAEFRRMKEKAAKVLVEYEVDTANYSEEIVQVFKSNPEK
jgi:hypothetical protein